MVCICGAALGEREHRTVDPLGQLAPAQDHAAARPAQHLVGGRARRRPRTDRARAPPRPRPARWGGRRPRSDRRRPRRRSPGTRRSRGAGDRRSSRTRWPSGGARGPGRGPGRSRSGRSSRRRRNRRSRTSGRRSSPVEPWVRCPPCGSPIARTVSPGRAGPRRRPARRRSPSAAGRSRARRRRAPVARSTANRSATSTSSQPPWWRGPGSPRRTCWPAGRAESGQHRRGGEVLGGDQLEPARGPTPPGTISAISGSWRSVAGVGVRGGGLRRGDDDPCRLGDGHARCSRVRRAESPAARGRSPSGSGGAAGTPGQRGHDRVQRLVDLLADRRKNVIGAP